MTQQPDQPDDDSSYPPAWKPAYIREREERLNPTEMESTVSAMTDTEFDAFVKRTRGRHN
jgi:hypothetical protein